MQHIPFAPALLLLLAACASQETNPPAQPVPAELRPAAGEVMQRTVYARGVQIYECRVKKDDAQATEWAFVAPEAELFDVNGARVGKHYAGPHWEAADGSKVVGTMKARANAPQAGAIPWLLLTTQSDGPDGTFARISSVQRINTVGGAAPGAATCTRETLGQTARITYTADYVMFVRG
jgi:hypothetical protein